jgi:hypothetical protein
MFLHTEKLLNKGEPNMNSNLDGQMIRRGIIMLGYHNGAEGGDVLSGYFAICVGGLFSGHASTAPDVVQ